MSPIAQLTAPSPAAGAPPALPPLPEGPSLERLRAPVDPTAGPEWWQLLLAALSLILIGALFYWLYQRGRRARRADAIDPAGGGPGRDRGRPALDHGRRRLAATVPHPSGATALRYGIEAEGLTHRELLRRLPPESGSGTDLKAFFHRCEAASFSPKPLSAEARERLCQEALDCLAVHAPAPEPAAGTRTKEVAP